MNAHQLTNEQLERMLLLAERQAQLLRRTCLELEYTAEELDTDSRAAIDRSLPIKNGGTIELSGAEYQVNHINPDTGNFILTKIKNDETRWTHQRQWQIDPMNRLTNPAF